MSVASELAKLFGRDLARLRKEIAEFPSDEMLWQTLPGVTNSAGNLALHLEGNLREFIGRQLGGIGYQRDRPLEFHCAASRVRISMHASRCSPPRFLRWWLR